MKRQPSSSLLQIGCDIATSYLVFFGVDGAMYTCVFLELMERREGVCVGEDEIRYNNVAENHWFC